MKRSNTTRFRATYSREVTSRACDPRSPRSCPRRNLFTPVFTRPDRLTLVRTLVSGSWRFSFFLSFFLGWGGGGAGAGADLFSFMRCKVRESAARKLNRGQKRKQFSFRAAVTLKNHRRKNTTKNPLATQASATFVRSGSINFNLFLF